MDRKRNIMDEVKKICNINNRSKSLYTKRLKKPKRHVIPMYTVRTKGGKNILYNYDAHKNKFCSFHYKDNCNIYFGRLTRKATRNYNTFYKIKYRQDKERSEYNTLDAKSKEINSIYHSCRRATVRIQSRNEKYINILRR